jgi:hypothetical protein
LRLTAELLSISGTQDLGSGLSLGGGSVVMAMYALFVDTPSFIIQKYILKRTPRLVGSRIYSFVAKPFSNAAHGNLSAFRVISLRYVSRLLVVLHAESRMNMIKREINYRNMDNAASARFGTKVMDDIENAREMFDLFEQITRDRYKISGLIVLGPLLSIMSIFTQKLILPFIKATVTLNIEAGLSHGSLYGSVEFAMLLGVVYAIWIAGSAFNDKRRVLENIGVYKVEESVFTMLRVDKTKEFPVDIFIFLFIGLLALVGYVLYPNYLISDGREISADVDFVYRWIMRLEGGIFLLIPCVLALLALRHRLRSLR